MNNNFSYGTISPVYRTAKDGSRKIACYRGRKGMGRNAITGRYYQKSFYGKTPEEVKKNMREYMGYPFDPNTATVESLRVSDWTNYWFEYIKKPLLRPSSVSSYRHQLDIVNEQIGERLLLITTRYMLQGVINMRELEGRNTEVLYAVISNCFRDAYEMKMIPVSITKGLTYKRKPPKVKIPLSKEDDKKMKEYIADKDKKNATVFLRGTACRLKEVLGLTWDRVFEDSGYIMICQQLQKKSIDGHVEYYVENSTKNGVFAPVYAPRYVFDALRDEKIKQEIAKKKNGSRYNNKYNLVFTDEYGNPLRPNDVYEFIKEVGHAIGREDISPHHMRHTRGSEIYNLTKDPLICQALLRHKNLYSTLRYLHLLAETGTLMEKSLQMEYEKTLSVIDKYEGKDVLGFNELSLRW